MKTRATQNESDDDLPTPVSLTAALTVFTNELPPPSLKSAVAKIAPTPMCDAAQRVHVNARPGTGDGAGSS